MTFEQSASKVIQWARDREIIPNSTPMAQAIKTAEEVVELLKALNSNNHKEVIDAYGDIVVTLLVGSELYGVRLEGCLETAYQVIKDRKGTLGPDGIFRKES